MVEFRNERIYHAPATSWAGTAWEVMLGAVDDNVYKVSCLHAGADRALRNAIWENVDAGLRMQLGASAVSTARVIRWDTEDGNVVLNRADNDRGISAVVITLTSRVVSSLPRVR